MYYDAVDTANNTAIQVTRTVTVKDTEAPVITLLPPNSVDVNQGDLYTDLGATVSDNVDSNVTLVEQNNVNTNTPGVYSYI
jgi:hypothetical protein